MIVVRPYRDSDEASMQALNERAMEGQEPPGGRRPGISLDLQKTMDRRLAIFVAVESDNDDDIIGMVALRTTDEDTPGHLTDGRSRVAELTNFRVSPDHQRKGIGGDLIKALINWGNKREYDTIIVNATPSRVAAMGVYRSLGFHQAASSWRGEREILWFERELDAVTAKG